MATVDPEVSARLGKHLERFWRSPAVIEAREGYLDGLPRMAGYGHVITQPAAEPAEHTRRPWRRWRKQS
jgi:hypothetical protein